MTQTHNRPVCKNRNRNRGLDQHFSKRKEKYMTAKEIQKRNQKAETLRVLQTDDGQFFVESGEGQNSLQRYHQR